MAPSAATGAASDAGVAERVHAACAAVGAVPRLQLERDLTIACASLGQQATAGAGGDGGLCDVICGLAPLAHHVQRLKLVISRPQVARVTLTGEMLRQLSHAWGSTHSPLRQLSISCGFLFSCDASFWDVLSSWHMLPDLETLDLATYLPADTSDQAAVAAFKAAYVGSRPRPLTLLLPGAVANTGIREILAEVRVAVCAESGGGGGSAAGGRVTVVLKEGQ